MLEFITDHPLYVVAMLAANVVLAEWLARHTPLRRLGSALLVILSTAVCANTGLMPTYGPDTPIYDGVFRYLAPLAIFWLLLGVNLRDLRKAGGPMLILFSVGALGTLCGVLLAYTIVGGDVAFDSFGPPLAGMFVGTYTGGSVNFNAIAQAYAVNENGTLYAAANLVDSAMTTVWMAACVFLPGLLKKIWPEPKNRAVSGAGTSKERPGTPALGSDYDPDTETTTPKEIGLLVLLGGLAVACSDVFADWANEALNRRVPSMLILTTAALVLAQVPAVQKIRGARLLGMFAVMIFLAVIGALCDLAALLAAGDVIGDLCLFVSLTVLIHGILVFLAARLLRLDPATAAVASQANIGGGTTALALARSLDRSDLVLPAILVGSLGTSAGTFLGFSAVNILGG